MANNRELSQFASLITIDDSDRSIGINTSVGIGTTNPQATLHVVGDTLVTGVSTFNTDVYVVDQLFVGGIEISGGGSAIGTDITTRNLSVTGISTFSNGPVLIGSGTSTGTASQPLQVAGGAYFSGPTGVGATLPFTESSTGTFTISGSAVSKLYFEDTGYESTGAGVGQFVYDNGNLSWLVGSRNGSTTTGSNELFRVLEGGNLGIGTTNPTSRLQVQGDARVSGVVTATTFIGALTGIAASATKLVTPRTFEITGDVVATAISFDGTGNVSLAATIQPNSVGLGTDTTGNYVRDITGTSNQITVTSGTGEGSTPTLSIPNQFTPPQDVTVTRDLQVNRNLNVNGNITIGGTSATLFTTELKVYDPDLVLGFRTDALGNDVSTDNTANHGGIAVASTEGSPLVSLFIAGIETTPATYKKIMWFKSGTFTGLNTDAWLTNYAIGVGSTQVPLGVRLAAGGMQVTDSTLSIPQLNVSGVSTFSNGPVLVGTTTATGTASQPLQVTGGGYFSGSVGIGVTNPGAKLIVANNAKANIDNGLFLLSSSDATNPFQLLFSRSSNTVSNPYYAFQPVEQNVAYRNLVLNNLGGNVTIGSTLDTGTASQPLQVTGSAYVSGNLGVGVTNPGAKLVVDGDVRLAGLDAEIEFNTGGARLKGRTNALSIHTGGGLDTETSEQVRITTTGVGIGTTNPGTKLNVVDNSSSDAVRITQLGAGNALVVEDSTNPDATPFVINAGGAVGIGTTNPSTLLHLNSTDPTIRLRRSDAAANAYGEITSDTSGLITLKSDPGNVAANSGFSLTVDNTERVRVSAAGSVGIGTTNPTAALTIATVGSATTGASQIYLNGATSNRIDFNINGLAVPAAGRSAGTKIVLYPSLTGGIEYAIGVEPNHIWQSVPAGSTAGFKWYGGTTELAVLKGDGNLGIGTTNPTVKLDVIGNTKISGILTSSLLNVGSGGTIITTTSKGLVGIGTTNAQASLHLVETDFSIYDGNVASQKSSVILSNSGANDNLALYLYDSNTLAGNTTATLGLGFAPGVDPNNLSIGGYLNNFGERLSIDEDGTIELKGSGSPYGQFSISQTTNQITFLHNQRSGGAVIGYGKFSFQNAPFEITGTNSDLYVAGITTVNSNFVVNGNTLVADATNNRVGIGTTLPQSALDVRGAVTLGIGTVGINSIFSTTDIQSWQYTNKSTAAGDTAPVAVYVGAAGTTLFVVGDTANAVIQYTLSTPYDVSTAGAAITTYSVATQDTNPTGIDFKPDGTKMFISGLTGVAPLIAAGEYVHEYSLSVAWDLSPTSIVGYTTSYNITQDTAPQGVAFGNNGSKMYVVGSTGDAVYQYSLSTPYSLASGVTYDSISLILGTLETAPIDISFNSTGTVLWVIGQINDRIYQFNLGTAWDISTAVFYDDIYIGFNEITPTGLQVLPEQNVAYIVGSTNDTVYQYSTNTPTVEVASSGISTSASIILNNETRVKDKLYVKGAAHFDGNILTQGTLTVDASAVVSGNLTVSGGTITAGNVATALLSGNTTTGITLGQAQTTGNLTISGAQTTGTINIGAAAQTGAITIGLSSASQTLNLATGASGVGTTKTINLGTGGVTNSFTRINIGPTAGVGTITINSGTNLGIGTTSPTTTLQVQGNTLITGIVTGNTFRARGGAPGALGTFGNGYGFFSPGDNDSGMYSSADGQIEFYSNAGEIIRIASSGNVGIATTNPLTTLQVGSVGVAGSSVFAVTGIGSVGIGTTLPVDRLTVFGRIQILQDTGSSSRLIFRGKPGNLYRWNIDNDGNTNNFRFFREDDATAASGVTHFQIDPGGNTLTTGIATVGLGATSTPPSNSQLSFELTTNTNLRIKVRGTDGILRTANITLG